MSTYNQKISDFIKKKIVFYDYGKNRQEKENIQISNQIIKKNKMTINEKFIEIPEFGVNRLQLLKKCNAETAPDTALPLQIVLACV